MQLQLPVRLHLYYHLIFKTLLFQRLVIQIIQAVFHLFRIFTFHFLSIFLVAVGDPQNFVYDPHSGYYIDPNSGIYHDRNTGTFYNPYTQDFLYIDQTTNTLIPFAKNTHAHFHLHHL
uniref:RNA-binding protein 5 (Trinotate prediction) n=1 Tax=Myxobolus squamalis TaxID=59785 RepID=A0A6B2FXQ3_MYXSQ